MCVGVSVHVWRECTCVHVCTCTCMCVEGIRKMIHDFAHLSNERRF